MLTRMRAITVGALMTVSPVSALAAGSVYCDIEDSNITMSFRATYGHGFSGQLFQLEGVLAPQAQELRALFPELKLSDEDLKQQWFVGNDLKFIFFRDAYGTGQAFNSINLMAETVRQDQDTGEYEGHYTLRIDTDAGITTLEGKATCSTSD